jgi:DNA polymerase III alpha subunit
LKFDAEDFYLKSGAEMRRVFAELPEACDATLDIAERVQLLPELERVLVEGVHRVPAAPVRDPAGEPFESYLRELVRSAGTVERMWSRSTRGDRAAPITSCRSSRRWGSPGTS